MRRITQLCNLVFLTGTLSSLSMIVPSLARSAVLWDTLNPNSDIAFSSQLDTPTETADDFTVTDPRGFNVQKVSILGLLSDPNAKIDDLDLAFYQVFPGASDLTRTPATVRTNGPEDTEFVAFSLGEKTLSFTTTDLGAFTVSQTILPGSGANTPGVGSGVVGGPLTGKLVQIDATLNTPLTLPAEPVFLVAAADASSGDFFRVAGDRPPAAPDPLPSGVVDRQAWFRTNAPFPNALEPDWVRISDVINQQNGTADPAFNAAFQVTGEPVPEPASVLGTLVAGGLGAGAVLKRRLRNKQKLNSCEPS